MYITVVARVVDDTEIMSGLHIDDTEEDNSHFINGIVWSLCKQNVNGSLYHVAAPEAGS